MIPGYTPEQDRAAAEDERRRDEERLDKQRAQLYQYADSIEKGVLPGDEMTWQFIAYHLRGIADLKKLTPRRGQPPKVYDYRSVCFLVHQKRLFEGLTREQAIGAVADLWDVDDRTVAREYDAQLEDIRGFFKDHPRN